MAYFAEIDSNNIVLRVLAIADENENRGQDFLANDLGLGGRWIQTSYNNNIRRNYAGIGFIYNENLDIFIPPQPYPSWTLNSNGYWQAPVPIPMNGRNYSWSETEQKWIENIFTI